MLLFVGNFHTFLAILIVKLIKLNQDYQTCSFDDCVMVITWEILLRCILENRNQHIHEELVAFLLLPRLFLSLSIL
ncbi:hypothetical protein HanXRQr2_Chr16g0735791 [Helianthus annuus]|uniref:Uncharacterized protein n=1 Tax=Helianthus annuus TaxID=4232 RepID=A0A9K3DQT2_HELAN|nr:hypothetical protein HanXRQr2_Chr16g0735791 [Helianthus annuus]